MQPLTSADTQADKVTLSRSDAREIARLLRLLLQSNAGQAYVEAVAQQRGTTKTCLSPPALVAKARAVFQERKRREEFLSRAMLGEPAWDMLLGLYIDPDQRMSVGRLVTMVAVPQTTALRWIDYLEKERLIMKRDDPDDRRFVNIELLDRGRKALDAYFDSLPANLATGGQGSRFA